MRRKGNGGGHLKKECLEQPPSRELRSEKEKYQPVERDGKRVFFPGSLCSSGEHKGICMLEDKGSHVYYRLAGTDRTDLR